MARRWVCVVCMLFVIRFFTDSFFIDTFGNHSAGALVRLDAGIAMHISVGNRLPANYLPNL